MFATDNIPADFKNLKFRLVEEDDVTARVGDAKFLIALTPALASDFGTHIYNHVYLGEGKDAVPRPELVDFSFNRGVGRQDVTLKAAPDLPKAIRITDAVVSGFRVARPDPEKPRLTLEFTITFHLTDTKIESVVGVFGDRVFVSFLPVQGGMFASPSPSAADRAVRNAVKDLVDTIQQDGGSATFQVVEGGKVKTVAHIPAKRSAKKAKKR